MISGFCNFLIKTNIKTFRIFVVKRARFVAKIKKEYFKIDYLNEADIIEIRMIYHTDVLYASNIHFVKARNRVFSAILVAKSCPIELIVMTSYMHSYCYVINKPI